MLHPDQLLEPQVKTANALNTMPRAMLWARMGFGKTVTALSAISTLFNSLNVYGVVIVSTVRVIQTVWRQEAANWSHIPDFKFSLVHGKPQRRIRELLKPANIYLVNYENLPWFVHNIYTYFLSQGKYPMANMLLFDEITKLKNARILQGGKRAQELIKILPYFPVRWGMTGTPNPNGYLDLFGQYLVIDDGHRLGVSYEQYRERFFRPVSRYGYKYRVTDSGKDYIHGQIADITLSPPAGRAIDPPRFNNIKIQLPGKIRDMYETLEREFFIELESGKTINVVNAAAKHNRCLQIANGAIYTTPGQPEYEVLHKEKIDALEELIEEAGEPVLVAYSFRHDIPRILERFKDIAVFMHGKMSETQVNETVAAWNAGDIRLLLGHPGSIAHGMNLQFGSSTVCYFGQTFNYEWYFQFMARIYGRHGVKGQVMVHHIIAEDTLDYAALESLQFKEDEEVGLRRGVEIYRQKKYGRAA